MNEIELKKAFEEIPFKEVSNYDYPIALIAMSLALDESDKTEETLEIFTNNFRSMGLIKAPKKLIGIKRITGNVRGNKGRTDNLLLFDHPELGIDSGARLQMSDRLKWVEDFIANYSRDFR